MLARSGVTAKMRDRELIDRKAVAELLGCHEMTTYRWPLPSPFRLGPKTLRWDKDEILKWRESRRAS
jgi:predicted DNA-binding transcriptional regulator AlpA